jgi:hypothetical protein
MLTFEPSYVVVSEHWHRQCRGATALWRPDFKGDGNYNIQHCTAHGSQHAAPNAELAMPSSDYLSPESSRPPSPEQTDWYPPTDRPDV